MTDNRSLPAPARRRHDFMLTLLAGLYFVGVVLGTVFYCTLDGERSGYIDRIAENFIAGRLSGGFWENFLNSFSGAFLLLALCFFMGSCVIAAPAEAFIPLFRGIGAGAVIAGMYGRYGYSGIGASALLIVPNAVFSAFVLIMASREAVRFSNAVFVSAFGRSAERERPDIKLYFTKFVILCSVLAVSSLADSLITLASAGVWKSLLNC